MGAWFDEGIRFACQNCGACCIDHGDYNHVFLAEGDDLRLARALGITLKHFRRRYTVVVDETVCLENRGDACIFLEKGNRCRVHRTRPLQCKTWPFWPENLERRIWRAEIAPHCPGIGKGRLHTAEEIDRLAFLVRTRKLLPDRDGKE
ncbi:MAG: YkgJ family cysteine cluster protein [Planctomycetota bacterium]|jgi:Fe-S-cluster containining protein